MIRALLLLAGCASVNRVSEDVYQHQRRAAAFEAAGEQAAAESERRRISRDQARLQRKEMNVPSWHFPQ